MRNWGAQFGCDVRKGGFGESRLGTIIIEDGCLWFPKRILKSVYFRCASVQRKWRRVWFLLCMINLQTAQCTQIMICGSIPESTEMLRTQSDLFCSRAA